MSDFYEYWFFPELEKNQVAAAKSAVLNSLWSQGLFERENNPDCVLGGKEAYAPTKKLAELFSLPGRFRGVSLTLLTRGLEVVEGFGFRGYELNQIDGIQCPSCSHIFDVNDTDIYDVIDVFHKTQTIPEMSCRKCAVKNDIRTWKSDPKLTFTHLGFALWNQPPLKGYESDGFEPAGVWKLDIPALMEQAAESPISFSYGRL